MKKSMWVWLIIIGALLLCGNILVILFVKKDCRSDWLTLISGWVSGVSTLIVGIIAYKQSKHYKIDADAKDKFIDVVIESVKVVEHSLPYNVIGRKCVPQDSNLFGRYRFLITIFAYKDNPVFDITAEKTLKDNKLLVPYDLIQPIQKGDYGRTFLCKNEFMQLVAEIPKNDNLNGQYKIVLRFVNQYGDYFQKDICVQLRNDFSHKVARVTQTKAILITEEQNNG